MKPYSDKEKPKINEKHEKNDSLSDDFNDDSDEICEEFEINEHIDCRDSVNKWLDAEIIAVF